MCIKKQIAIVGCILSSALNILSGAQTSSNLTPSIGGNNSRIYHQGRIIIKPKSGTTENAIENFHRQNGFKKKRVFKDIDNIQVLEIPGNVNVSDAIAIYNNSGLVEFAEPDYVVHTGQMVPNDSRFLDGSQWNLNNTGQWGGTPDADIDAPEAWGILNSATNIVVAIVDSGVRYTHEDLRDNMWVNVGEIPGNGKDDDGNGFVDDIYGINAVDGAANPGDPNDDFGHGTHVAGIIGAVGNNNKGVCGVAWRVKLMACKFIDANNNGYLSDAIQCIDYARSKGAKIINASWGSTNYSSALLTALNNARSAGIIVVCSAGNESRNNDSTPTYPASYNLDNIVSVAATDNTDQLANYSNYGVSSVDLAAPGTSITSTFFLSDSSYLYLSGSSMAAPHVAGACALAMARFPLSNYRQIIKRVYESIDPLQGLSGKCVTGGRLNLYKLLSNYQIQYTNFVWVPTNGLTAISLADDGVSSAIPLPFVFNFYGENKTSVYIGANGLIGFNSNGLSAYSNVSIATTNTPNDAIYVYWDDLNPASKGKVYYGVVGSAPERRFVVVYDGVPRRSATSVTLTFEVILEENTHNIILQYLQAQPSRLSSGGGASSATIGIENKDGTRAAEFTANGSPYTITNNTALAFIPYLTDGMAIGPAQDLTATGPPGGPFSPASQIYYITNTGGVQINWAVYSSQDWLTIYPSNGALNAGVVTNINISINERADSLPVGTYRANVSFTNITSGAGSIIRTIVLTIYGTNGYLEVSPVSDLNSSGYIGGPFSPENIVYTLANTGDATLNWEAYCAETWITLSASNGRLTPLSSVTLIVSINTNANLLSAGNYSAVVEIRNKTTGAGDTIRTVQLRVNNRAGALVITPETGFESSGIVGGVFAPSSKVYQFYNAGEGVLSWSITHTQNWYSLSSYGGILNPSETNYLTVSINSNATALPPGLYTDALKITVSNGSVNTPLISMTLLVNPEPARLVVYPTNEIYLEGFAGTPILNTNYILTIGNSGGSNLFWDITFDNIWLNITKTEGVLSAGETTDVTLSIISEQVEKLPPGLYTNQINIVNLFDNTDNELIFLVLKLRPKPVLEFSKISSDTGLLKLIGETNFTYVIEGSSNLIRWFPIYTNTTSENGEFSIIETNIQERERFYYRGILPQ